MITRDQIIQHIMNMHTGIKHGTPQPAYADYITKRYDERLPWMEIVRGVKAAKTVRVALQEAKK